MHIFEKSTATTTSRTSQSPSGDRLVSAISTRGVFTASPLSLSSFALLPSPRRFDAVFPEILPWVKVCLHARILRHRFAILYRDTAAFYRSGTSRIAFLQDRLRENDLTGYRFASIVILSDITQRGRNVKLIRLIRTNGQSNDAHFLPITAVTSAIYTRR